MKKAIRIAALMIALITVWHLAAAAAPTWPPKPGTTSSASTASKATASTPKTTSSGTSSASKGDDSCAHAWADNSGTTPGKHCTICGADYCELKGHTEEAAANCSHGAICSICKKEYTEKKEHIPNKPTKCSEPTVCTVCGATLQQGGKHDWQQATCQTPKTCRVCGEIEGTTILHRWGTGVVTEEATEDEPGSIRFVCETCGEVKNQAIYAGESKGNSSAVIWMIIGGVVLIAAVFALVYFLVIRKKQPAQKASKPKKSAPAHRK